MKKLPIFICIFLISWFFNDSYGQADSRKIEIKHGQYYLNFPISKSNEVKKIRIIIDWKVIDEFTLSLAEGEQDAPSADNPSSAGHNTFIRTRNLDGIPFNSSFSYDMEILSWIGGTIDASATTYWYGFKGAKDNSSNK